jgi:hypothetical protein
VLDVFDTPAAQASGRVLLRNDPNDIVRRIQDGDPTCFWSGDPDMYACENQRTGRIEVWRACEDLKHRVISSWEPAEFDARVLKNLFQHDTRVHNILERIDAENLAVQRDRARRADEEADEAKRILKRGIRGSYISGVPVVSPGAHIDPFH